MSVELLHTWLRAGLVIWSTLFMGLLVRSLILAYWVDYRHPWSARARADPRSRLDHDVLVFVGLMAILGALSVPGAIDRMVRGVALPVTPNTLILTAYTLVFSIFSFRVWRGARRERLRWLGRAGA